MKNFLVDNFLWFQNQSPGNTFELKILSKIFWSKLFYGCNIISSETPLTKNFLKNFSVENFLWLQNPFLGKTFEPKFSLKIFWSKVFCGCKIISSETPLNQNFQEKFFGRTFLRLQNHFRGNTFEPKYS